MYKLSRPTLDALVPLPIVGLSPARPTAQRFQTLTDLLRTADGVLLGEVQRIHLFRIERRVGVETFFTTITLMGASLCQDATRKSELLEVTFQCGSIEANQGTLSANAPGADELQLGRRMIVFYRWMDDLGAGLRGYGLVGNKAGLYQTKRRPGSLWVRGRGRGFGIAKELPLSELRHRIERIEQAEARSNSESAHKNN